MKSLNARKFVKKWRTENNQQTTICEIAELFPDVFDYYTCLAYVFNAEGHVVDVPSCRNFYRAVWSFIVYARERGLLNELLDVINQYAEELLDEATVKALVTISDERDRLLSLSVYVHPSTSYFRCTKVRVSNLAPFFRISRQDLQRTLTPQTADKNF